MRSYQLVLVLKSDLSPSERKKLMESLNAWLSGLKISSEKEWGTKNLSYEIKKQKEGLYLELAIEGENIPMDFEKRLLTSDNILRHLLLRKN